ncbi:MAG: hypothetical protein P8Z67_03465 [Gammaproteobacteria bacterium]
MNTQSLGSYSKSSQDPRYGITRIDRRRKLPVTILLKALGFNAEQILDMFFEKNTFNFTKDGSPGH